MLELNKIHQGDWIELAKQLDDESIDVCMTSPPYWGLRDYGVEGQLGLESHPQKWINKMVEGLAILKKKLKKTGSLWLNVGDTYYGKMNHTQDKDAFYNKEDIGLNLRANLKSDGKWLQPKQLMLMPSRLAIALQDDGWILRNDCIWHKPNPMPSSVRDRLNTTYEHVFHFVKSRKYYYDLDAIREPHKSGIALSKEEYEESKLGSWHNHELDDTMGQHQGINTPQELHYHPSGKNPWDVILTKRELLLETGMVRNGREGSTLGQPNKWNKSGKNPGDVYECIPMYTDVDFWQITTQPFPEAHFATYPVKLCEKPIKATLPKEICIKCGFIRERITKVDKDYSPITEEQWIDYANKKGLKIADRQARQRAFLDLSKRGNDYSRETIGWTSCNCNAGFKAGIILDTFCGAGTTFVAMYEYNPAAKFIGFELNQKYIDMAMKRLKPHMEQTRLTEVLQYDPKQG